MSYIEYYDAILTVLVAKAQPLMETSRILHITSTHLYVCKLFIISLVQLVLWGDGESTDCPSNARAGGQLRCRLILTVKVSTNDAIGRDTNSDNPQGFH